mmetsp:Transcript_132120/g.422701  ORF Transcript_132120/g.422701 Transcript_132120/m.422701 type:complete len:103 (+) Transcript_132120:237-545(+)
MVDERIDQSDMGEMSLDGIWECSREPPLREAAGARAGWRNDQAFTEKSSRRNERELRRHGMARSSASTTSRRSRRSTRELVWQNSRCIARAGGRVAPEECIS